MSDYALVEWDRGNAPCGGFRAGSVTRRLEWRASTHPPRPALPEGWPRRWAHTGRYRAAAEAGLVPALAGESRV